MTEVLVKNAGDTRQVKRAARIEREREEDLLAAVKAVLETEAGKTLLMGILNECHVFSSVFSSEPFVMAKLSGEQDIGHKLVDWINQVDVVAFPALLADARRKDDRLAKAARFARERDDTSEEDA